MKQDLNKVVNKSEEVTDREDFLHRWSRRKHEAQQSVSDEVSALSSSDATTERLPTDADMPPLDTLTDDSDYSGFFSPKVSETLRQQALRKLFRSAGFNIRDGLDDYDDDFTAFAELGDIVTADMQHQFEKQAQRLQELADDEQSTSPEDDVQITSSSAVETRTVKALPAPEDSDDDEVKSS